ncbi:MULTISPECIES: dTDP-glucose 4,6-dehydratase [Acidithiobacillus]|uniref:dTDP-glucose 4,6-dehydratase n=3 Tax=Acidithiobacillus caldus TaxID=33059 RepID=F9ZSV5_ACICS|nr:MULTISPECIES: dTDP-glucose 4,6-dehydratase [Acidithiobacillus]AEK57037.1 dTDP-glucose 4,6-dehydratase [Acidithiobacillus caldus SM-1]AIA54303.1 dTDP-glucose 4,6-dehydratase [Acidithiobacillus caldus ATCC 51756]AUW31825.1 dTDP-glucose 4,6-dehydratase [Acidithiobacillus caldus]MBU2728696.1 dTDP-glucose 4,6-dehydratase [Acidithiobacillus caldus]MBU2734674.1 dTDP-glucose 4,6-dehydratase [Acidithiobacillus caldus ATCC 51756]
MPNTDIFPEKRLLVTGGAGFIGANFCHYWLQQHPRATLVVLDALTYAGNRHSLAGLEARPGFRFVQGDINDEALVVRLLRDHRLNVVVHFAAESHVDRSIHDPDAFIRSNILGTHSLLRAAKTVWLDDPQGSVPHRFHHISTDEVYGSLSPGDAPFREDTPYAPNSPYAASKAGSDHLVRAYHHTYGLQTTTSNCSNNYGPFHFPEKLIPLVILNILHGKTLPIYGDGRQIRDWLYVEDHCRGIAQILERGTVGESYNIGGCNEWSNLDIVELICAEIDAIFAQDGAWLRRYPQAAPAHGRPSAELIQHVRDRPGHDRRYAIDASKIRKELGFAPQYTFAEGIRQTIRWYLEHREWWQPVLDGSYRDWIARHYG